MRPRNPRPKTTRPLASSKARKLQKTMISLRRNYGLSLTTYRAMLASQGGVCALCKKPPAAGGKRFSVDHCHKTGFVRGLLCTWCNYVLGMVEKRGREATAAISEYVANPPGVLGKRDHMAPVHLRPKRRKRRKA